MAGQRTRLRFGAVSAEVLLEKTSTKPRGAQHETRRGLVEVEDVRAQSDGDTLSTETIETTTDPFGDPGPLYAGTIDLDDPANRHLRSQLGAPAPDPGEGPRRGLRGPMGAPTWTDAPASDEFDAPDPAE